MAAANKPVVFDLTLDDDDDEEEGRGACRDANGRGPEKKSSAQPHRAKRQVLAYDRDVDKSSSKKRAAPPEAGTWQERRRERRERDARLRSGESELKRPVIEFDAAKALTMQRVSRCGIQVHVPKGRPPYRSQLQVMDGAIRAASAARSALLESPTGTGKTAAALAATLAWQRSTASTTPTRVVWVARTHDQLQHAVREYRTSCCERPMMSLRLSRERFCLHPNIATAPNKAEACEEATKIKQDDEQRKMKKKTKDTLLSVDDGTRARRASKRREQSSGCAHLDKAEAIGYPQSQRWRPHFKLGGKMETWDIEEAVAEGHKLTVCPFHLAQDLIAEGAALVFITYQQLVEPITRRAGGLDQVIEDAVVVVDEAHNLPQVARDAASLDLSESRLSALVDQLEAFVPHLVANPKHREASEMLASLIAPPPGGCLGAPNKAEAKRRKKLRFEATARGGPLVSLLAWLRSADFAPLGEPQEHTKQQDHRRRGASSSSERVWDGASAALLAREVVGLVSAERVDDNCAILAKLRKTLIEEGLESGAVRSDTINDLEALLVKLRYVLEPAASHHYRLVVLDQAAAAAPGRGGDGRGRRAAPTTTTTTTTRERSVRFVCLSGSVAMHTLTRGQRAAGLGKAEYLRPARSLLLLSGTLRPFDLLADELGFELRGDTEPVDDEAHCSGSPRGGGGGASSCSTLPTTTSSSPQSADDRPLSEAYIATGVKACHLPGVDEALLPLHLAVASGVELDASYQNSTADPASASSVAYFDALATALVGVVSASPNGVLVFFKSYKLLGLALDRWTATGRRAKLEEVKPLFVEESGLDGDDFDARLVAYRRAAATPRGAVLLAVMRGRAAEGADFKDDAARVCVVVGVPYPPRFEVATRLKLDHVHSLAGTAKARGTGEAWYRAEAFRNVNQAAGRLIRHKRDYGALVLLDKNLRRNSLMSEWYSARLETLPGATVLHHRLKAFFDRRHAQRQPAR